MQFIDEAKIFIKSGDGGDGCVSFRREAHTPKGGPDGGNGGRGGSIIAECVPSLNTLIDFRYQQHFKAKKGHHGMGKDRTGPSSEDIIIKVPLGTQIFLEDGELMMTDFTRVGQRMVLAAGGSGGLGNANFKSSVNQAPRRFTPGEAGEEQWLWLRLKLLSDAGLVGMPNAGKSTFLSRVSRARPKIADYPFTTLKPQLGVTHIDEAEFVLADIPGLIEDAHKGSGLGDRFLKHIERCRVIIHLLDGTEENIVKNYKTIRNELEQYSNLLHKKQEIIAINKCDALSDEEAQEKQQSLAKETGKTVHVISAQAGAGVKDLLREVYANIREAREAESVAA